MDIAKLASALVAIGIVLLLGALVWWYAFYSEVVGGLAASTSDWMAEVYQCIWSTGGRCGIVSGIAAIGGKTPYEPMVFWIGAITLGLGLILRAAAR